QLGRPPSALIDGATSWDDIAVAALETWNPVLQRSQFGYVKSSNVSKSRGNGYNNVFFDSTIYGQSFGDRVLAVTLMRSTGGRLVETDVVVNTANTWNSYRGNRGSRSSVDLQRVLVHEFGHALGLDHPDQATPPQNVAAIMNSMITNIYTLQNDDIAGAQSLYGPSPAPLPGPGTLTSQSVNAGAPLTIALANPNPNYTQYAWTFTRPGGSPATLLDGDGNPWTAPTYRLFSAQPTDTGTYAVAAVNGLALTDPATATVEVKPVSTAGSRLANLSARARAGSGDDTFIVGFVIGGKTEKRVLIHALGPALSGAVSQPLGNPRLRLLRHTGNGVFAPVAENDDWSADATDASALRAAAQRLGAAPLPSNSRDAALLATLPPGVYSAQVDAQGGTPGIALVEVYDADADTTAALPRRLMNISSRSFAGSGEQTLIAGFVVDGSSPKQVL
ncbi:MAG TPA: matrixin family metalloprotease, partial [Opitutus sp.]|nr:matrixin family metalloprotease [Opitutus sp.]